MHCWSTPPPSAWAAGAIRRWRSTGRIPTLVVADLVYVPLETALLAAARRQGLRTVDGLGMLLHQARPGFAAWFGVDPTVDAALRAFVLADLPPA